MFWKADNAESMLQVRSQVVPDQWDQAMVELADFRKTVAYDRYDWTPQPMSCKNEDSHSTAM